MAPPCSAPAMRSLFGRAVPGRQRARKDAAEERQDFLSSEAGGRSADAAQTAPPRGPSAALASGEIAGQGQERRGLFHHVRRRASASMPRLSTRRSQRDAAAEEQAARSEAAEQEQAAELAAAREAREASERKAVEEEQAERESAQIRRALEQSEKEARAHAEQALKKEEAEQAEMHERVMQGVIRSLRERNATHTKKLSECFATAKRQQDELAEVADRAQMYVKQHTSGSALIAELAEELQEAEQHKQRTQRITTLRTSLRGIEGEHKQAKADAYAWEDGYRQLVEQLHRGHKRLASQIGAQRLQNGRKAEELRKMRAGHAALLDEGSECATELGEHRAEVDRLERLHEETAQDKLELEGRGERLIAHQAEHNELGSELRELRRDAARMSGEVIRTSDILDALSPRSSSPDSPDRGRDIGSASVDSLRPTAESMALTPRITLTPRRTIARPSTSPTQKAAEMTQRSLPALALPVLSPDKERRGIDPSAAGASARSLGSAALGAEPATPRTPREVAPTELSLPQVSAGPALRGEPGLQPVQQADARAAARAERGGPSRELEAFKEVEACNTRLREEISARRGQMERRRQKGLQRPGRSTPDPPAVGDRSAQADIDAAEAARHEQGVSLQRELLEQQKLRLEITERAAQASEAMRERRHTGSTRARRRSPAATEEFDERQLLERETAEQEELRREIALRSAHVQRRSGPAPRGARLAGPGRRASDASKAAPGRRSSLRSGTGGPPCEAVA